MKKRQTPRSNPEMLEQQKQALGKYAEQLNQLKAELDLNEALSIKHGKITLALAIKAGRLLLEAQELVPKKEWQRWLLENVKNIELRTAQNYMRLAREVEAEAETAKRILGPEAKYVSSVDDAEGLREAYLAFGIIKRKLNPKEKGEMTPERMKNENKSLYGQKIKEARTRTVSRIRNEIKNLKWASWNLMSWKIENDKVRSVDEGNEGFQVLERVIHFVSLRNNTSLTAEDEIRTKAMVVVTEVLRAILLANCPASEPKANEPERKKLGRLMEHHDPIPIDREIISDVPVAEVTFRYMNPLRDRDVKTFPE